MLSHTDRTISSRTRKVYRIRDERLSKEENFQTPDLNSIKDHLNLEHSEDTTHLANLRKTATRYFERVTGKMIAPQTREVVFSDVSTEYEIPRAPWIELQEIVKIDEGSETTLDTSDYYVEDGVPVYVKEKTGTSVTNVSGIKIRYRVGYQDESSVPGDVKHVLRIMVGDMYEYRTSTPITGQSLESIPFDWHRLIAPHQIITL